MQKTATVHQMPSNTAGFIEALEALIKRRDFTSRGDEAFAGQFLTYLKRGVKEKRIGDHEYTGIWYHLPTYVRDAFDLMRKGDDADSTYFREKYIADTEREHIPDLVEIGFGGVVRGVTVSSLAHLMQRATGQKFVNKKIMTYFMAQDAVLEQVFDEFCARVYRCGLFNIIENSRIAGMSGRFGTVQLRTFVTAGRIMMTFFRKIEGQENEVSVTFVGEDGDNEGVRAGQQSVYCDLNTACGLIREVVANWPSTDVEQRKLFKDDKNIRIF